MGMARGLAISVAAWSSSFGTDRPPANCRRVDRVREYIGAARLSRNTAGDRWFFDESYVKVTGPWTYRRAHPFGGTSWSLPKIVHIHTPWWISAAK